MNYGNRQLGQRSGQKNKLGFIEGTLKRPENDANKEFSEADA